MRTAYLDIETTYVGAFTDSRLFQDYANHKITVVGIRVIDGERDTFLHPVIAAGLGVVLDKKFKHRDLCPECWKKRLYGGLKRVEQDLGLKRQLSGKDGKWADETWRTYQRNNDSRLLDELLAYNKEDVFMLRSLELALANRA